MTNTELLPKEDTATPSPSQPAEAKPKSQTALWVAVILLFVTLGAMGGAGYWFYINHYAPMLAELEEQRSTTTQVEQVSDQQLQLRAALSQSKDAQEQTDVAVEQIEGKVSALDQRIARLDTEMSMLSGARTSDWLIAEADYLTRMAGRKLWLEDDTRTAIKLLQEADLRLAEAGDPTLLAARRGIAADIQRIQQINPVSVTSVALSLSGIISTVDTLPLNALQLPEAESGAPVEVTENVSDWRSNLANVWHAIMDDFVTVRRREADVEPLMSDAQTFLFQEQLKLSLMQAQQAALDYNSVLYQESLKQALAIVASGFDLEDPQIQQLLSALDNLKQTKVERNVPTALSSHQLLQDILSRQVRRPSQQGSEI